MSLDSGTRRWLQPIAAGTVAVALLVAAGWGWSPTREEELTGPCAAGDRASALESTDDTGCDRVVSEPVGDSGGHIDDAPLTYAAAPPSYGDHTSRWEVRARSFYTVEDRPEVAVLVHNLEHGYNILWYDQSVIDDGPALADVREIADAYASLDGRRDPTKAFIAAPWTSADGQAFPSGRAYALTHWYADPDDRTRSRTDERGLTQYCADVSAGAVQRWMSEHPLRNAPEGYRDLM